MPPDGRALGCRALPASAHSELADARIHETKRQRASAMSGDAATSYERTTAMITADAAAFPPRTTVCKSSRDVEATAKNDSTLAMR